MEHVAAPLCRVRREDDGPVYWAHSRRIWACSSSRGDPGLRHLRGLSVGDVSAAQRIRAQRYGQSWRHAAGFTQWLEEKRGLSASAAGLVLLPAFVFAILVFTTTGRRPGIRGNLIVGALVQIVSGALLLLMHGSTAIWLLLGPGAGFR